MPFDASGNFTRTQNFTQDKIDGVKILSSHADSEADNFASGLGVTFLRSGLVPMAGNLNMGANNLVALGDGTASLPAIAFSSSNNSGLFSSGLGKVAATILGTKVAEFNAAGLDVTGRVSAGDTSFNMALAGAVPTLSFDTSDVLKYDRTGNAFAFAVGGTTVASITSTGLSVIGTSYFGDSQFYNSISGGNPTTTMDTSDYANYDRTANTFNWYINSVNRASINSAGMNVPNAFTAGSVSSTTVTGTTVSAGTLTASGIATMSGTLRVGDANFNSALSAGTPTITFDTSDSMSYTRGSNIFNWTIGGNTALSVAQNTLLFGGDAQFSIGKQLIFLGTSGISGARVASNVNTGGSETALLFDNNSAYFLANGNTVNMFSATAPASSTNYVGVVAAATGGAVVVQAYGGDTDVDLKLTPKGAGYLQFGDYASGTIGATGYILFKTNNGVVHRLLVG